MIQSPLNYTGGKYKLLPQILPLFPQGIDTFLDLFCGGGNVGANVECNRVWFNDLCNDVVSILQLFKRRSADDLILEINKIIEHYGLSQVSQHSYEYYKCNSMDGLGSFNSQPYANLRRDVNAISQLDEVYYINLYVLIIYAFNNQIRFNKNHDFNLPVGKRDFNEKMVCKLRDFSLALKDKACKFSSKDFRSVNIRSLKENDFVYADPPYLITCASYNENNGWSENDEQDLLKFLDNLHKKHIRFALSNVLESKGKKNEILVKWVLEHPEYTCLHLNYDYSNANYQRSKTQTKSDEVLIINY